MNTIEKKTSSILYKLRMTYGHALIDNAFFEAINEYKDSMPFWTKKLFEVHHDRALEYALKKILDKYNLDKW